MEDEFANWFPEPEATKGKVEPPPHPQRVEANTRMKMKNRLLANDDLPRTMFTAQCLADELSAPADWLVLVEKAPCS